MKRQSTLLDNDVRVVKLEYTPPKTIRIVPNTPKEYLSKSGKIITVEKKTYPIAGVAQKEPWYIVTIDGRDFKPLTLKGVIMMINK